MERLRGRRKVALSNVQCSVVELLVNADGNNKITAPTQLVVHVNPLHVDNRSFWSNRLTSLEVGIFNKNTALKNLYVHQAIFGEVIKDKNVCQMGLAVHAVNRHKGHNKSSCRAKAPTELPRLTTDGDDEFVNDPDGPEIPKRRHMLTRPISLLFQIAIFTTIN